MNDNKCRATTATNRYGRRMHYVWRSGAALVGGKIVNVVTVVLIFFTSSLAEATCSTCMYQGILCYYI